MLSILTKHSLEQPCFQGLSSLPPLVAGTETLVAAGHVTGYSSKTAAWVGSRFFYHQDSGWSRDQLQPGPLFQ